MFDKILIANRGEIALRVLRACKELGIDGRGAFHRRRRRHACALADESVCIGPPPARDSYLNIPRSSRPARSPARRRASRLRLPVGERRFAEVARRARHHLHRPEGRAYPHHGRQDHRQATAKRSAFRSCRAPTAASDEEAQARRPSEIGYPVLIKATAGGGGRGMKVARNETTKWKSPSAPPAPRPRPPSATTRLHREIPREAAPHRDPGLRRRQGQRVHLGERDCSLQRRHQKVWEEGPRPPSTPKMRAQDRRRSAPMPCQAQLLGAGTIEFLYEDGEFYFIEMNTRLQVEHPVTEAITGIDLVREQIRVAAGRRCRSPRKTSRSTATPSSAASTPRIPTFAPSPGKITLPRARRPRRARRFALYDGYDPALLRQPDRQADRPRPRPFTSRARLRPASGAATISHHRPRFRRRGRCLRRPAGDLDQRHRIQALYHRFTRQGHAHSA
jgi:acetyl-CoA carboxylase biotin carboxylase subunit